MRRGTAKVDRYSGGYAYRAVSEYSTPKKRGCGTAKAEAKVQVAAQAEAKGRAKA